MRKTNSVLPGAPSLFRRPLRHSATGHASGGAGPAGSSGGGGSGARDAQDGGEAARQAEANRLLRHKTVIRVRAFGGSW